MEKAFKYIADTQIEDKYLDELTSDELMQIIEAQDREFNDMYDELYSQIIETKANRAFVIAMGAMALVYFTVTIVMGFIDMLI